MAGLNKVILIGRVGKDPDTFQFDDGTKKMSFSLATTESYRDRTTGDWKENTEWHNVVGYRYMAEKSIAKGDLLYVEGKIKTRKYNDKDGNEKYITEIVGEKINILIRQNPTGGSSASQQQPEDNHENDQDSAGAPDDDLPF